MTKACWNLLALLLIVVGAWEAVAEETEAERNLKAFPAAEQGMRRHVLMLPPQADESLYKVQLVVGKNVMADARNHFFFTGKIESQNVEGWGFTKYVVPEMGKMGGTLIGVDPSEPQVERFVTLGGEPLLVRYNSQLPLVIYAPEGAEVKYRIWLAEKALIPVPAR